VAEETKYQTIHLKADEWSALIARARKERWRTLVLLHSSWAHNADWFHWKNQSNVYIADVPAEQLISGILTLETPATLALAGFGLGDAGARELAKLYYLTSLDVSSNQIGDAGARELAKLSSLTYLSVSHNQIGEAGARAILDAWSQPQHSQSRQWLDLRNNGDLSTLLPAEALETADAQAILAAYRRYHSARRHQSARPLNEAKLLVVGNEAVGKTSLIRYLARGEPRNESESPTRGTRLHEKIEIAKWTEGIGGVTLNIWDFGGQEILHGTHQFFLTRRSLYLLVLGTRYEDDKQSVFHWLRIIRNRGADSPVIIVINKCDGDYRLPEIDWNELRKAYPEIVAIAKTSCNSGHEAEATIAELRTLIGNTVKQHPLLQRVRDPFPPADLRIKNSLTELARKERVLERSTFERLCEQGAGEEAITDSAGQLGLLGILHELGVVVAYGLDREALRASREITLLDPNWLTTAIYTLLNSGAVATQNGVLRRSQLDELLNPRDYPAHWHDFILNMMMDEDIGLCLSLPKDGGEDKYLIPEALHSTNPIDEDDWKDVLWFRFQYQLLPRGLMPRFIVETHRNAVPQQTRWLYGVVLEAAGCKILVQANMESKRIDIRVKGPQARRRAALNIALDRLDQLHRLNPGLGQEARVPLPDNPAESVPYANLLTYEENPQLGPDYAFLPERAAHTYTARVLLEGVRRDSAPRATVTDAPPEANDAYWNKIALQSGAAVMALAIIIYLLPTNESRLAVGGLVALGACVSLFVRSLNPRYFYRRMVYTASLGFLFQPLDFTLDVVAKQYPDIAWLRFDGKVDAWYYLALAAIIGFFVWADRRVNPRQ